MWRLLSLFAMMGLANCFAYPQAGVSNPLSVAPDILIVVTKLPIGADMVKVTLTAPNYPLLTLQAQCLRLGTGLNSTIRGLQIIKLAPSVAGGSAVVKASFATDGIIDRASGDLHLQTLVQSFLGAPKPFELKSFLISFEAEVPGSMTIQRYIHGPIRLVGEASRKPLGLEYHIVTETQDPAQVYIPARVGKPIGPGPSTEKVQPALNPFVIPLVAIGFIGAMILVYFGVVRSPSR